MSDKPRARGVPCPHLPGPKRIWVLHLSPRPPRDPKSYTRNDAGLRGLYIPPQPPKSS